MKAEVNEKGCYVNAKVMFAGAIANAIVVLVLSGVTIWKAKLAGSSKSLRAGFLYGAIALGWVVSAFWVDSWNWALPTLLIVALSIVSTTDK